MDTLQSKIIPLWAVIHHGTPAQVYVATSIDRAIAMITGSLLEYCGIDRPQTTQTLDDFGLQVRKMLATSDILPIYYHGNQMTIAKLTLDKTSQIHTLLSKSYDLLSEHPELDSYEETAEQIESIFAES